MKIVNCKLKIAKQKGFTLIEILVAIAIIGILTATIMVNFGRNPDQDVRLERDKLVTFLRNVQNKTLAGERPSQVDASGCYTGSTYTCNLCGYGVKMDPTGKNIQVYYVTRANQNVACNPGSSGPNYTGDIFYPGNSVTVSLPFSADKIFFLIPQGEIYYNGSLLSSEVQINLSKTGEGTTVTIPVTIKSGGIIE